MKRASIFMALCMVCFSGVAVADPKPANEKGVWLLAKYDNNGDKVISLTEINSKRKQIHAAIDINNDGLVSYGEYEQMDAIKRASSLQRQFRNLDVNKDGKLNDTEYSAYQGNFDRLDLNNDGKLTRSEMQHASKHIKPLKIQGQVETKCLWLLCIKKSF